MSRNLSAEEVRAKKLALYPEPLGNLHDQLWQDVCTLHTRWADFRTLFGTSAEVIELLQEAAGSYFGHQQRQQIESIFLHIARLSDPPMTMGKSNLTLMRLAEAAPDQALKASLLSFGKELQAKCAFARDWRNRHIAHREFTMAETGPTPLAVASRDHVEEALKVIRNMMNLVEAHYEESETAFNVSVGIGDAATLLEVLKDGIAAQKAEIENYRAKRPRAQ